MSGTGMCQGEAVLTSQSTKKSLCEISMASKKNLLSRAKPFLSFFGFHLFIFNYLNVPHLHLS